MFSFEAVNKMKTTMRKLIFTTLLLTITFGTAQNKNDLWKKSNLSEISKRITKTDLPQKNIFELDLKTMKKMLGTSPKRENINTTFNLIITLPNGEGKLENFKVYENSVMAPELAAKYPEIKSYMAVGIDNPNARAYFSYSPLGFKSMTLYPNQSAVFIEPVSDDLITYSVYKKSDKKKAFQKFECNVIDEAVNMVQSNDNTTHLRGADDGKLRTFKLALSCTAEYAAYFGGTKAATLAAMNNSMTRINGVFEKDFGVRLILIANNDALIYTNSTTDPYSDYANKANWKTENQTILTSTIGEANYDIGHLLGAGTVNSGDAGARGSIGIDNSKGRAYTCANSTNNQGDTFDINYLAHEMGHQLGANHTFTYTNEGTIAQLEPGSGSTIMGYAGVTIKDIQQYADAYFHSISIQQVTDIIKTKTCATIILTGNAVPVANAGIDYTIPKGTPFMLKGTATDANSTDALTYSWEQLDLGNATTTVPSSVATTGPLFRSYNPSTSSTRYFPNMNTILAGLSSTQGSRIISETLPGVARTLNFRLTVRDNKIGGGANNTDDMIVTVDGVAGPFTIDSQNTAISYPAGSTQTINWTVAGTNANGVNCANVDILLSTDGGQTFSTTLLAGTPNDGSQNVVIPNIPGITNRIMVKGSNHIFFDVNNTNFTISSSVVADTTAPTASILTASGTTTLSTNLSWSASTDNVSVIGYDVYQNGVFKTSTTTTTLAVNGLNASTTYNFYVKAKDAAGNISLASNTVNVTTLANTLVATPTYCNSNGNTSGEYINRVFMGTIDNISGNNNGYGNYTAMSTSVSLGSTEKIMITPKWMGTVRVEFYNVWIDFNQNGIFESSELVFSKSRSKNSSVSGPVYIPTNALTGTTRMRVSMKYNALPSVCEVFTNGEVEDYSINIISIATRNSQEITTIENKEEETNEASKLDFKLYPNPVKGDIVNFTEMKESTSYRIYNLMGQQVADGLIENNAVNVSALMPAIYIIEVTDGNSAASKRFIKE
ncbi:putative secreted protein (Por secretion system target) [Flavobacterium aquaticum]|uniref:Putative secreted protein (Por secretion system target) n=2 Tax=Flavobacterium aquaticum TaxID=1236486 RepID=A0A327YFS8_9FLAO|nr:putative secreted protein (Por secretion system target) [Flavobacterium aquaticum]